MRHGWQSIVRAAVIALVAQTGAHAASSNPPPADVRRDAVVLAIERVMPSVINIATETVVERHEWYDDLLRQFYGWPRGPVRRERTTSLGSGVIVDEEGYVLTNLHVVRRASRIEVKLWDGREYAAEVVQGTARSDVALLKLAARPGEKFAAIQFAADDDLLLGETVLAVGNPFGLGGTVTRGILSSKNRRPSTGEEPLNVEDWLQTDAAINPGNSGGPLVNLRGELIGLNVAVYRAELSQGLGFSIPVKEVSAALGRFFSPEASHGLWFGAQLRAEGSRVRVAQVLPGSPAERAGLQEGDEVLRINGEAPGRLIECSRRLGQSSGHQAQLVVRRGSSRLNLKVEMMPFEELIQTRLGLKLIEPAGTPAERLGFASGQGLYVEAVEEGSPAQRAGLRPGSLLSALDGQTAVDLRAVGEILARRRAGDTVQLTLVVPRRLGGSYLEVRQGTLQVQLR